MQFSRKKKFKPIDLLSNNQNLKESLFQRFPVLDFLKGKFIFVITDGTTQMDIPIISSHRTPLNEYLETQKNNAICFVAPQISKEDEINQPNGFSPESSKNTVFYNLEYPNRILSQKINSLNCLSRVFGFPDESKTIYNELVNDKINLLLLTIIS